MLNVFRKLMPKEERFFDLFDRHAVTLVGGADALVRLLGGGDIEGAVNEIRDFENAADDVTRDVLVAVRAPSSRPSIAARSPPSSPRWTMRSTRGAAADAQHWPQRRPSPHELTEQIVHLEGRADELHLSGLKALFLAHRGNQAMDFIVGREIYSHVERVLDRLEDVADEIQGIVSSSSARRAISRASSTCLSGSSFPPRRRWSRHAHGRMADRP